jgi:hypothetical protein
MLVYQFLKAFPIFLKKLNYKNNLIQKKVTQMSNFCMRFTIKFIKYKT